MADPVNSSDEAIEAAAQVAYECANPDLLARWPWNADSVSDQQREIWRRRVRPFVEAAEPIIAARVRAEASTRAHDCEVAAAALWGLIPDLDELSVAHLVARRAEQFEVEARTARAADLPVADSAPSSLTCDHGWPVAHHVGRDKPECPGPAPQRVDEGQPVPDLVRMRRLRVRGARAAAFPGRCVSCGQRYGAGAVIAPGHPTGWLSLECCEGAQ